MPKKKVGQSTKRHHRGAIRAEIRRHFGRKKKGETGAGFRAWMGRETEKNTKPGDVGWAGIRYSKNPRKGPKKQKPLSGEDKPKRTGVR